MHRYFPASELDHGQINASLASGQIVPWRVDSSTNEQWYKLIEGAAITGLPRMRTAADFDDTEMLEAADEFDDEDLSALTDEELAAQIDELETVYGGDQLQADEYYDDEDLLD